MKNLYAGSYFDVAGFMGKARDPERGRPAGPNGYRWKPAYNKSFRLLYNDKPIVTYHPGNIAEFHIPPLASRWSTLALSVVTPFTTTGSKPMRVAPVRGGDGVTPQTYDGLKYDLTADRFINPLPDLKDRVNKGKQAEWLAKRRDFLTHIKTLARIGALDKAADKDAPYTACPPALDILYGMINGGRKDPELLDRFLYVVLPAWGDKPHGMEVYNHVESVVKAHSLALRLRMGVFKEGEQ